MNLWGTLFNPLHHHAKNQDGLKLNERKQSKDGNSYMGDTLELFDKDFKA